MCMQPNVIVWDQDGNFLLKNVYLGPTSTKNKLALQFIIQQKLKNWYRLAIYNKKRTLLVKYLSSVIKLENTSKQFLLSIKQNKTDQDHIALFLIRLNHLELKVQSNQSNKEKNDLSSGINKTNYLIVNPLYIDMVRINWWKSKPSNLQ